MAKRGTPENILNLIIKQLWCSVRIYSIPKVIQGSCSYLQLLIETKKAVEEDRDDMMSSYAR